MKLIHYSNEHITKLENITYDQDLSILQSKPIGLWFSIEDDNEICNWKEWCINNNFFLEHLEYAHVITLNKKAKILHLKTVEDIFEFTTSFGIENNNLSFKNEIYRIDWHKIKKIYQGILISPLQKECSMSFRSSWYYGWDCASGCVWDLTCIDSFELTEKKLINENKDK